MTTQSRKLKEPVKAYSITAPYERGLALAAPFDWLRAGWRDTLQSPISSLAYGGAVFVVSLGLIAALWVFGFSYILLPAVAGFMLVGPMVAIGLYEKSRLLAEGEGRVALRQMIFVRAQSPGQLFLVSVLLLLVMLFWLRTAILLYALFYGLDPFEGLFETAEILLFTERGRTFLTVGTMIGAMMTAFTFAMTAFSIPMLMREKKDAITAMVLSLILSLANARIVLLWGALVLSLFVLSVLTGFIGLIVVFPLLGHASWHAFRALKHADGDLDSQSEGNGG